MIDDYYARDANVGHVDKEVFSAQVKASLKNPKHWDMLGILIDEAFETDVSTVNLADVILKAKLQEVGVHLGTAAVNGEYALVRELIPKFEELAAAEELADVKDDSVEVVESLSVAGLMEKVNEQGSLIKLLPTSLNKYIGGGCYPGTHIFVFARPETGKTAACTTLAKGFIRQGLRTLYLFNEDPLLAIQQRTVCCLTGLPQSEIMRDPAAAEELLAAENAGLLILVSMAPGTLEQIEALIKKYEPKCIIVDQIRNLRIKSENRTIQLEQAATGIRTLAKKYGLVAVSISQAGDSASNKKVLDMGDVDGSNTGIPGQADLMIGIGLDDELERNNERMFSLCKNKINGVHGALLVHLNRYTSTYTSI